MAYAADLTTNQERGKAMGWLGAAISLGFMIGPGIGGLLSNISMHFPFYFGGFATIFAGILSFIVLPTIKPVKKEQPKQENHHPANGPLLQNELFCIINRCLCFHIWNCELSSNVNYVFNL